MRGAGLHRLVVPEDRVRPDAPLAVVDNGALVVRPEQHHRAVEIEQLLLAEAFDLAVFVDHTPELVLLVGKARHSGGSVLERVMTTPVAVLYERAGPA